MRQSRFLAEQLLSRTLMKPVQPPSRCLFSQKSLKYRQFSSTALQSSKCDFKVNQGTTPILRNTVRRAILKIDGVYFYDAPRIPFYEQIRFKVTAPRTNISGPIPIRRWIGPGLLLLLYLGWAFSSDRSQRTPFDPPRFTPFIIVNRKVVSPTSIILTLRPQRGAFDEKTVDPYKEFWEYGLWSVEVKQPELQIARSYTPLPPSQPNKNSELRFLIRKEQKGEVSGYLHSLPVGSTIELRGPHRGFDIPEDVQEVMFLAGGTGIAPALQVAHTLLERRNDDQARIRIVWSNRRREDCESGNGQLDNVGKRTGRIVREFETLQRRHPGQLTVDYLVDEENTFLDQRKLSRFISESEKSIGGMTLQKESKLLFISGPEGFINYFAGPKKWEGGKEGQGGVGGLIGQMRLKDWVVFKL